MLHLVGGEELAESTVLDVVEVVVGHQPLRDDPVAGEDGESAFDEAGHGLRSLVVVELDVGEQRVALDVSGEPDHDLEAQAQLIREQRKSRSAGGYSFSGTLPATPTAARRSG